MYLALLVSTYPTCVFSLFFDVFCFTVCVLFVFSDILQIWVKHMRSQENRNHIS